MNKNKERSIFWQLWLEKYKSLKCLWNGSNQTSSKERLVALKELMHLARIVDANANIFYVQARLQEFFRKYKMEEKKIEIAKANGISYKPKAYYYNIFKEIRDAKENISYEKQTINPIGKEEYRKNWRNVLTHYVSYQSLWNKNGCQFEERMKGWKKLTKLTQVFDPNVNLNIVMQRIKICRRIYLREKKKRNVLEKNGLMYRPKLFYYDILDQLEENKVVPIFDDGSIDSLQANEDCQKDKVPIQSIKEREEMCKSETEIWCEILKNYVSFKCIWDRESSDYGNADKCESAWKKLLQILQTYKPDADLKFLKNRIHRRYLICRRQFNRANYEKQHGRKFKSKLIYYDILKVLFKKEKATYVLSSEESSHEDESPNQLTKTQQILEEELKQKNFIFAPLNIKPKKPKQKNWLEVLRKYTYCECLWNPKNRDYYNADERNYAWQKLSEIAKKINPAANVEFVKKRIRCCRTTCRQYLKIAQKAKERGNSYDIKLYYFNALSPIYQKNFPILNYDNDDVVLDENALEFESVLNPASNTHFPDDDDDDVDKSEVFENYEEDKHHNLEHAIEKENDLIDCDIELLDNSEKKDNDNAFDIFIEENSPCLELGDCENSPNKKPTTSTQVLEAELEQKNFIFAPLNVNPEHSDEKIWLEVIKNYVHFECLWNTENRDYFNVDKRLYAWKKLTKIAKKANVIVDVNYTKKRIQHFRSLYERQLKIAQEAKECGKNYDIKLYYFNALSPIYQKNFPKLTFENNDMLNENALDFKSVSSPTKNTHFPDSDENEYEGVENYEEDEYDVEYATENKIEFIDLNIEALDGSQENVDPISDFDFFENETQLARNKREDLNKKQKIKTLEKTNVKKRQNNVFNALEEKIAQHLESMEEYQYLLTEKLVSDVCISGRQKELTKKSFILLKKGP